MYLNIHRVDTTSQYAVMKDTEDDRPGKFLEDLERKLKIEIIRLDNDDIEFDLTGIDASVANALRRIMLAEVIYAFDIYSHICVYKHTYTLFISIRVCISYTYLHINVYKLRYEYIYILLKLFTYINRFQL
jgi:hypothetical protein